MRIAPSQSCTDREFIRRIYLDVLGVLPTPEEVRAFLADTSPTRRDRVIDRLLVRPEFYDFWALKFADVLRSNGRLIQTKGAYVFHRWIRECLERNLPMDQLVRALADIRRIDLQKPRRQLLPDQSRPGIGRRDDGPAFPGGSHPVRQVPQPPLRALDAGRLLRIRRVLLANRPQEGQPARRRGGLRHGIGRRQPAPHRAAR